MCIYIYIHIYIHIHIYIYHTLGKLSQIVVPTGRCRPRASAQATVLTLCAGNAAVAGWSVTQRAAARHQGTSGQGRGRQGVELTSDF